MSTPPAPTYSSAGYRCVQVIDQAGSNCLPIAHKVARIHDGQTFQEVFDALHAPAGLQPLQVHLKADTGTEASAATELPNLTSNVHQVIDIIRKGQRSDPCVIAFVVSRQTAPGQTPLTTA